MAKHALSDDSVIVVIGSGAGGGTLANELCQKGFKVVLLEAGQPVFQFFDQPSGKTLGFSDREFAELSPAAGNSSTKERRAADAQSDRVKFFRQRFRLQPRHVDHQQILHVGGAQLAAGEPISEIGSVPHLLCRDSSPQYRRSHIAIARLLLGMDADVVTVKVSRRMFGYGGIQMESDALLQLFLEVVSSPPVFEKEEFEPRSLAMFAQLV